jgi:non-ribosomal peptide synthetase component F
LPCRLTTEAGSWRGLLLDTYRVEAQLLAHIDFPVDDLRRDLSLSGPFFETVFDPTGFHPTESDPTGNDVELSEDTVLWMGISPGDEEFALRLRYRTDVFDADSAARIAGYHLTALELMTADPDAEHGRQSLLSAGELYFQLEGLAGPRRELPDCRVHELFEQQVEAQPEVVAAVHGTRQWTYRELNRRANRLARAVRARGVGADGGRPCGLQGRWCVSADRAAFPGGSYWGDAVSCRLRSGVDRAC